MTAGASGLTGVLLVGGASERFGSPKAQPMTLSMALCRPTSSRTHRTSPSSVKRPVAWRPPVRSKVGCADLATVQRSFYTSSSCGVCGKGALEAVAVDAARVDSELAVAFDVVASLPRRLRSAQPAFDLTGGLHATGLFTADGELRCVREDVGRHNAMDKVIGWAFLEGMLPLARNVLCVSGRLSFELVQKAAVAGCPVLVAVGAPSSLAVELADDRGLTLCGFVRDGAATVYTHPHRVLP